MATTVRLPADLKRRADAFAAERGVSLNAVLCMALGAYLDRWEPKPATEPASAPKVGRNEPCPCGSGKKFKLCHGRDTV